jgi:hypothetical protein|tara:strand:- start:183 stop:437 length:255 start_codon:yes stop_codon:yes gene_type:complete
MESNNKFGRCSKCPAFMDDSRLFTNYLPNSKLNTYVTKINNITNNDLYRIFLQKNASKIMENEKKFIEDNKKCSFPVIDVTENL